MPRTQRLIVASLALVMGLGLGFLLSGIFDFQKLNVEDSNYFPAEIPLTTSEREFKVSLETVMRIENKDSVGGFTPEMLMRVFPRLLPEDFAGAAAVIGQYQYKDGQLVYTNIEVLDGAADNLSDEGIRTFRENVYRRLNLSAEKNSVDVMQILKAQEMATSTAPIILPANGAGTICPQDAKLCPDGSSVSRTGLSCEFAACPNSSTSSKEVTCADEQRDMMCTQQYEPVCASYQVQCIKAPCNPVPKEYGNGCTACSDKNVISYSKGQCATPAS